MDNSNSAFLVPNNKDDRPLKDLVPSLPMGKRGQDWITVHQRTYNTAHYTPPLEALKYAHSKTDFTLCAGGVDEVNYPFNDSMANSLIATKPISLSPSIAWGQNRAQSIIEMFNNPNLRSFYFVPCTDNNYEQAKEDNLPTMQKDVDDFVLALSSTPHNVKGVVALPGFDDRCVPANLMLLDYRNSIQKFAPFIENVKIYSNVHLNRAFVTEQEVELRPSNTAADRNLILLFVNNAGPRYAFQPQRQEHITTILQAPEREGFRTLSRAKIRKVHQVPDQPPTYLRVSLSAVALGQLDQQPVHEDAYQWFNKNYGGAPDDVTVTSENAAFQRGSLKWQKASLLGNNYARVDIEMSKDDALSCAKDIISLTKDKAEPTFAFPLFLTLPNDAQGYTVVYAIATKRVKTARNDKGRIPMLELIDMAKNSTVYGACIGLCPRTPWSVLLAFDNSMLHDTFEAKSPTLKVYWSLIQAGLYCVNAHTMKPFAVTHDANDQPIKEQAPKFNLQNELEKLKSDSVALVEANKATTHLDILLTAAAFGLFEKTYARRPAASIFTKQVYEIHYNSPNSVYLCDGLNVDGISFAGRKGPNNLARDKLIEEMKEEAKTQGHENEANDEMLMIIRAGIKLGADEQMKSILQGPALIPKEPKGEKGPPEENVDDKGSQRQEDQTEQEDEKQEVSLLIRDRGGKVIGGLPTHTDMTWMWGIDVEAQATKKAKGLTAFNLGIIIEATTVQIEETTVNLKEVMVILKSHVPHGSSLQDPKHLSRRSVTHRGWGSLAIDDTDHETAPSLMTMTLSDDPYPSAWQKFKVNEECVWLKSLDDVFNIIQTDFTQITQGKPDFSSHTRQIHNAGLGYDPKSPNKPSGQFERKESNEAHMQELGSHLPFKNIEWTSSMWQKFIKAKHQMPQSAPTLTSGS